MLRGDRFSDTLAFEILSPAESEGYFKSLGSWRIPLLIETTVLKAYRRKLSLWKLLLVVDEKCRAGGGSPVLLLFLSSTSLRTSLATRGSRSPQSGPQPQPWTVNDSVQLSLDYLYFLNVLSFHLLSQCLS